MDFSGNILNVAKDWMTGRWNITLQINEQPTETINELAKCEKLSIILKRFKKKRSLDANAYLWVLCTKIADKIGSSKDEVYEDMIQHYPLPYEDEEGHIVVTVASKVDMRKVDGHWLHTKTSKDGKFKCYVMLRGSSDFDSAEMARFIDKIVYEAKNLGIETLPPDELQRMVTAWKA